MPSSSSSSPALRAETTNRSACSAWRTTALAPSSCQPPSMRRARVSTRAELVLRARLAVRQHGDAAAVEDAFEQRLLRLAAGLRDGAAGEHGGEEGLDDEAAAERLEHDREVEAGAAVAAVGLAEQRADGAELGEAPPQVGVHAFGRGGDAVAHVEGVLLGDEAVQAVRQHAAVFGMGEVHGAAVLVTGRGSSWR